MSLLADLLSTVFERRARIGPILRRDPRSTEALIADLMAATSETAAIKIEQDLMEQLPEEEWIDFSHRLILHGRQVCRARKPRCEDCSLQEHCPRIGVSS